MNIYIKSFNRPYLLHRTLLSILHFLEGFNGEIFILDDGTPEQYLQKIEALFPDVQIVKSPFYKEKSRDISENKTPSPKIPANFWRDIIAEGTEKFILLEDDMWFCEPLDFLEFKKEIDLGKIDMIKFFWLKNEKLISNKIVKSNSFFSVTKPMIITKNAFLFDSIFRTNRNKIGSIVLKFKNYKKEILPYYQLYSVAGSVFSREYYLTCWGENQEMIDETQQIFQLLKNKKKMNVGNTKKEILKTSIKTTASLISKEKLGKTIDIYEVNRILNEEWLNGNFYKIDDFQEDIPSGWIKSCLEKQIPAPKTTFAQWQNWYDVFRKSYESIGCKI